MNAAPRTISDPFQPIENASATLPAGALAPDFALKSTPDQIVRLSEFRGQPVVLVFYPADWSPVCGDQVSLYNEMLAEFQELGAEVAGISVDGPWCHARFPAIAGCIFLSLPISSLKGSGEALWRVSPKRRHF